jgi:hypothetical protein
MAKLIIKSNSTGQPVQVIELRPGVNRFGRSPENDHLLVDPDISDRHCDVLVDNEFVFVRDLESTNGTFIDGDQVHESALYSGQTLRIGPVEMILDAPPIRIALPEMPKPQQAAKSAAPTPLADGYPSCLKHPVRHAIWECTHCQSVYCDECIRKLRRVGGVQLKLCPACSNPCKLTAWSEMMRGKKKDSIKRTVRISR